MSLFSLLPVFAFEERPSRSLTDSFALVNGNARIVIRIVIINMFARVYIPTCVRVCVVRITFDACVESLSQLLRRHAVVLAIAYRYYRCNWMQLGRTARCITRYEMYTIRPQNVYTYPDMFKCIHHTFISRLFYLFKQSKQIFFVFLICKKFKFFFYLKTFSLY